MWTSDSPVRRPVPPRRGLLPATTGLVLALPLLFAGCIDSEIVDERVRLYPGADVLAVERTVDLREEVSGDVMAAGRSIRLQGSVGGSYLGVAGDQEISGRVEGSVRAAGGSIRIEADVERNITVAGRDVSLDPDGVVAGNAYLAGGTVTLQGRVDGHVYAAAGEVVLDGTVGGDVRVEAGTVRLGPDAFIEGELRVRLPEGVQVGTSPAARLEGGLVELTPREDRALDGLATTLLRLLGFLLAGVVLVALVPGTALHAADEVRMRGAAALGYGVLAVLLTPLVVLALAMTVVGLPLAVMLAVLYLVSLYVAPVVPGVWLGSEMLRGRASGRPGDTALLFLAGGAVVAVALLLPWVGFFARALATCIGFGAIALLVRDGDLGLGGGAHRGR